MSELANYSIETDHTVLLAFRDGRKLRVPVGQLAHHLAPPDLEKVRAAIKLRREFIRRHMPKAVLVFAAGGLIALLAAVGGHEIATLFSHPAPAPVEPTHTGIVRSQTAPSPAVPAVSSQPSVQGDSTVAAATATATRPVRHTILRLKPLPKSLPVVAILPTPLPTASPAPSPTPSPQPQANQVANGPDTDAPGPSPLPTPQVPNQGQVLGCSTADPAACDDSSSTTAKIP